MRAVVLNCLYICIFHLFIFFGGGDDALPFVGWLMTPESFGSPKDSNDDGRIDFGEWLVGFHGPRTTQGFRDVCLGSHCFPCKEHPLIFKCPIILASASFFLVLV